MKSLDTNPKKQYAIELTALTNMTQKEIAEKVEIPYETLKTWRRNPDYHLAVYNRFMIEYESELPAVLQSMVREAKSGNVQAARLVLEHSGKLVKQVNVTISPWEKFLNQMDAEDAEIVEDDALIEIMGDIPEAEEDLPPRDERTEEQRTVEENKAIKEALKREAYNQKQKEWYRWKKRAKAVGVEPLKAKRPTKGQRKAWEDEIIKRESDDRENN